MFTIQNGLLILSASAALSAGMASYYWFKSALPTSERIDEPVASISDAPEHHIQVVAANASNLMSALEKASSLNKLAAIWSGVSAAANVFVLVLGMLK